MITVMLLRPRGLWPSPEHGKSLTNRAAADRAAAATAASSIAAK
jgi:branched-chain amino acid transport system permease protein